MKVAIIQLNATGDKDANIKNAVCMVNRAINNKAEFILLPEFFVARRRKEKTNKKIQGSGRQYIYTGLPLKHLAPFFVLAKKHKVFILAGSVYERMASKSKGYNTAVLINEKGSIEGTYRKINLFEALINDKYIKEGSFYNKGKDLLLKKINGFFAGVTLCYDLRFPDLYGKYSNLGADIFCVPSSFTKKTGEAHWEILLRARAIENLCYVLAPNQIGIDSFGVTSYGNSMIIDPWGNVLARASADKEEIIYADLKKEELKKARERLPKQ